MNPQVWTFRTIDEDAFIARFGPRPNHLDLNASVREGARRIETEGFEIAHQHLHGGDAADLHRRDEILPRREGHVGRAPKAQTRGVGEIGDGRRARRRDIEHTRIGQGVL